MRSYCIHSIVLLKRLSILVLLYSICRVLFLALNYDYFKDINAAEFPRLFLAGIRFDLSALAYCNIAFIFFSLLPLPFRDTPQYERFLKFLFYFWNIPALLISCADFVYFRFNYKRITADIFTIVSTGEDFVHLLPRFVYDYYYLILLFGVLIALAERLYRCTSESPAPRTIWTVRRIGGELAQLLGFLGLLAIAARGGTQGRPTSILSAARYGQARAMPLVLNTPFTILRSIGQDDLSQSNYFPPEKLTSIFSPIHPARGGTMKRLNVVVIILESFAREFVGSLSGNQGYTPFLDSLIEKSLVFDNAYANGKNSAEALPAVLASLPSLMARSYLFSSCSSNAVTSFATLLEPEGYATSIFHGGTNGTMGFDAFSEIAGFDHYYGRTEYNNDADYDGSWGINDEEFLQYVVEQLNRSSTPFFSSVFTLSSHHPFEVPKKYRGRFRKGPLPIEETIGYADFALQRFFESAQNQPWYKDTLFVITADHTPEPEFNTHQSNVGIYEIPILFFRPGGELKEHRKEVFQQIDILPTVLDLLNYPKAYYAFGGSIFDKTRDRFAINVLSGVYQYITADYVLHMTEAETLGLFDLKTDPLLKKNVSPELPEITLRLSDRMKAILQTYNYAMMHNELRLAEDASQR